MQKLARRIRYPVRARLKRINGKVIISFGVVADGELKDFEVLRDIGGECGKEALRTLRSLTHYWIPGRRNEVAVHMIYRFLLNFNLVESR